MLLRELRTELALYARKMHDSRPVQATQGNLSVRDQMTELICITPSDVQPESSAGSWPDRVGTSPYVDGKTAATNTC